MTKNANIKMGIMTAILLISNILLATFTSVTACACFYSVGTYEDDYITEKNSFYKGEIVYGKGMADYKVEVKLRIRDPYDNIVYYSNEELYEVTGYFLLDQSAPTGTWNIQLGLKIDDVWEWSTDLDRIYYFTVAGAYLTLTINTDGDGYISKEPDKEKYDYGDIVNLTAIADPCWSFDSWSGDLEGNENPAEIIMDDDKTVTAVFTELLFNLTINVEPSGCGVIYVDPEGPFHCNDVVTVYAIPYEGFNFCCWSGDYDALEYPAEIIMDDNKIVTAHFVPIRMYYILSIEIEGNGSVVKDPDQTSYVYGSIVELTANPDSGYVFGYWSGDLTGDSNSTELNITEDTYVTAHFNVSSNVVYMSSVSGRNAPPKAIAGGPYLGYVNETITFNGSKSYDRNNRIISYQWDLGDGTIDYGEIVTHFYSEVGEYKVVLTVTDTKGATGSDEAFAIIIKPNNPPSEPNISGPSEGIINTIYIFGIVSIDDGGKIKYTVDWGDGNKNESLFIESGELFNTSHEWTNPGIYTINVKADDGEKNTKSQSTIIIVKLEIAEANNFILILLALLALMVLILILLLTKKEEKDE